MCARVRVYAQSCLTEVRRILYICVPILLHMCPHTTIYVSSYYYMCAYSAIYVSSYYFVISDICVLSYCYICVRILSYYKRSHTPRCAAWGCPRPIYVSSHTAIYVSAYSFIISGLILPGEPRGGALWVDSEYVYACPHTAIHMSAYYYIFATT